MNIIECHALDSFLEVYALNEIIAQELLRTFCLNALQTFICHHQT